MRPRCFVLSLKTVLVGLPRMVTLCTEGYLGWWPLWRFVKVWVSAWLGRPAPLGTLRPKDLPVVSGSGVGTWYYLQFVTFTSGLEMGTTARSVRVADPWIPFTLIPSHWHLSRGRGGPECAIGTRKSSPDRPLLRTIGPRWSYLQKAQGAVLPVVRVPVPGRERRLLETMQLAIGEFITDTSQGLQPSPRVWGQKGPEPQFSRVFIRSKKAAGSWHKWIGYTVGSWCKRIGYTAGSWCKRIGYTVARQFLLAQRGAFSFPLIGSLFLARRMLIG